MEGVTRPGQGFSLVFCSSLGKKVKTTEDRDDGLSLSLSLLPPVLISTSFSLPPNTSTATSSSRTQRPETCSFR